MCEGQEKHVARVCPKTGRPIGSAHKGWWLPWVFPFVGLASLVWFLIRVIPKPSRATYPCQRLAAPLASGFVVWLTGIVASTLAYRKARRLAGQSRYVIAGLFCRGGGGGDLVVDQHHGGHGRRGGVRADRSAEQSHGRRQGHLSRPGRVGARSRGDELGRHDRRLVGRRERRSADRRHDGLAVAADAHRRDERCRRLGRPVPALQSHAQPRRRRLPAGREDRRQDQHEPGQRRHVGGQRRHAQPADDPLACSISSSTSWASPARPSRFTTPPGTSAIRSTTRSAATRTRISRACRSCAAPRATARIGAMHDTAHPIRFANPERPRQRHGRTRPAPSPRPST